MSSGRRAGPLSTTHRPAFKGTTFTAAFRYTDSDNARPPHPPNPRSSNVPYDGPPSLSPRRRAAQLAGMNGYNASTDLPPPLYVRALYNYEADDPTSLSFRQGDIIQVLTQLESGWWDGVIEGTRGWFPSNYCTVLSQDDTNETDSHEESETSAESGTDQEDDDYEYESDMQTQDEDDDLPGDDSLHQSHDEAGFWIPQATPDGRLFYFNTRTGVSAMELPLETPSSTSDTGPSNSNHFRVPAQTRPPPEMMSGGNHQEDGYEGSASEAEAESSFSSSRTSRISTSGIPGPGAHSNRSRMSMSQGSLNPSISSSHANLGLAPIGTTATSFSVPPQGNLPRSIVSKFLSDNTSDQNVTWASLVNNMSVSVEAYRQAIKADERAEYVRRAEDISDHLRLLLAAGSGTTDNHSGNPSIISTNKALYPHFREMMSKFSKLVLSSHIAAADWPGPEAGAKCLQEADGVMHGVCGYVEVARQQRGEEIPRLHPGFVAGKIVGGHWQGNNVNSLLITEIESSMNQSDSERSSNSLVPLDSLSLRRVEEIGRAVLGCMRRLEDQLRVADKIVTPAQQVSIGDAICLGAGDLIEHLRPWITLIESIDLSLLVDVLQKPWLLDFSTYKQKVYDSIGELVTTCQAVTAPLPDEWAEMRAQSLETRLASVRVACKQLESNIAQVTYSLRLLEPATSLGAAAVMKDQRITEPDMAQSHGPKVERFERPRLGDIGRSKSYGQEFDDMDMRPPRKDKARQFFGQVPPTLANLQPPDSDSSFKQEERPWYLELDHTGEITYDYKTDPPQVRSGTLAGLVEQLTRHDRPDTTFNTTFLLTYRSFISAEELFQLLVRRFNIQPPAGLSRDDLINWEENKQKPVRFRVVNILKTWLEHYWMESNEKESLILLERLNAFAKNTITNTKIPGAGPLVTVIDQRIKGQDTSAKRLVLTLTGLAPQPILPKNMKKMKFLDIDTTEFARQLTITESKLYGKIRPVECLEKIWEKKDKSESSDRAPNIQSLILHSNQLTNWVAEMILSYNEVKKRVVVIKHFVAIADKCWSLNNFSTLTAIISALGTAPILRLNRTWAQVPAKTKDLLEAMRQLIASTKNFGQYREALHVANPPCIPFLGVYLTDLTFIEDGIASVIKNTDLINFTKRTKTAEVIRDIQQYQNVPYTLNEVQEMRDWILDNMRAAGDVHEMYNKSLQIEPREREEEKIARLLSESGFL